MTVRLLSCVLALFVVASACSSDPGETNEAVSEATPTTVIETSSATENLGEDAAAQEGVDEEVATEANDCADAPEPGAAEDPWLGLEDLSAEPEFAQIASIVRDRTAHLTEPGLGSCTGFAVVDRGLDPADFGALAVRTFEHTDPYVRYDVFVYESRQARTDVGAYDLVDTALPPLLPVEYPLVNAGGIGEFAIVAGSYTVLDDGFPPEDVIDIITFYGDRIAGFE